MSDGLEKLGSGQVRPVTPRRRWSEAEKRRIVAESYQPGVSVLLVARRNDVNANQMFTWRRRYREQGGFVPVVVEPAGMLPPPPDAGAVPAAGRMEIALADGSRVIVDRDHRPITGSSPGTARRSPCRCRWSAWIWCNWHQSLGSSPIGVGPHA